MITDNFVFVNKNNADTSSNPFITKEVRRAQLRALMG